MIINLDNYDQYLSMYVDNELSAAERAQVESFLNEHPYLQDELEALQQTVLRPEKISYFDKSSLLKPELSATDETKLLLHLDNELSKAESQQVEKEIAENVMMAKEWQFLQKTRLDAGEKIEYPFKQELYRREEGRVIRMPWLRWAAAAAIIGVGFYLTTTLMNAGSESGAADNGLATNDNGTKKTNNNSSSTTNPNVKVEQNTNLPVTNDNNPSLNEQYASGNDEKNSKQQPVNESRVNEKTPERTQQKNELLAVSQPEKDLKNNRTAVVQQSVKNEPVLSGNEMAALQPKNSGNTIGLNEISPAPKVNIIDQNIRPKSSEYAQTASLNFDENDNSVFLVDEDNISRSKAGILLKKLKRNVERRANLKPGKSLRIAGFEFAVK